MSKLFPELERLPTRKDRRQAIKHAFAAVTAGGQYWLAVAAIVAVSVFLQFSKRRLGIPMAWRGVATWVLAAVTIGACWGLVLAFRKTIRRELWRTLVKHGVPCCTSCGHNLTGNESGICSECGTKFEASEERRQS